MALLRLFKYFATLTAGAIANTSVANPSTQLNIDMTGATGVQSILLPGSNMYPGEVVGVLVRNAVAIHTVDVKTSAGVAVDQFAASTNGARLYVWNGTTWVPAADPS